MAKAARIEELDKHDKEILKILQVNAKASLRDMAKQMELSTTSIRLRIKNLQDKNIIKDYIALIDCRQIGYKEMILASLRVNARRSLDSIKQKVEAMEEIKYAYIVTGEYPIFIMAKCLDHNDTVKLLERLRNLEGIEEIKTQIVLDRIKEDPTIIIPQ
ncbi:MAG: AsnC family transcriptional regulator [Candidatus Lokiarchaeota archaeon]|nr:AsnC family transcriptional regulator [Candidatus Lokiarchaeota archaeon]MBD3201519.1 AsnC family transcriptional regulator [Candidatus Lokiarchaeota archaeon]